VKLYSQTGKTGQRCPYAAPGLWRAPVEDRIKVFIHATTEITGMLNTDAGVVLRSTSGRYVAVTKAITDLNIG
jgi:hypothetical protein